MMTLRRESASGCAKGDDVDSDEDDAAAAAAAADKYDDDDVEGGGGGVGRVKSRVASRLSGENGEYSAAFDRSESPRRSSRKLRRSTTEKKKLG